MNTRQIEALRVRLGEVVLQIGVLLHHVDRRIRLTRQVHGLGEVGQTAHPASRTLRKPEESYSVGISLLGDGQLAPPAA